jgi:hypothetical protein
MQQDDKICFFAYFVNHQMKSAFNEYLHPKNEMVKFSGDLLSRVALSAADDEMLYAVLRRHPL